MRKISVRYATSSPYKRQEIDEILASFKVNDAEGCAVRVADRFTFEFPSVSTDEPLERDLERMVRHKVRSAYRQIMAPCIVEHAGLVLERFEKENYPGGLTQPMWDALDATGFVESVRWSGDRAIARAVVGYCDGLHVRTFIGETRGVLSPQPRGSRAFYWDTVFCPDGGSGRSFAEIAEDVDGVRQKITLSQSTKAMKQCLEHLIAQGAAMFPEII